MLRKIFVAKGEKITGYGIKLHNAELYALYSSLGHNLKSLIEKTEIGKTCCLYEGVEKYIVFNVKIWYKGDLKSVF